MSTSDALTALRRMVAPRQWKSIRSLRLSVRFNTFKSYYPAPFRIGNPEAPIIPQNYGYWKDACRDILAMAGLKHFVLDLEMIGSGAEDYHWREMFEPLQSLRVEKWDVEALGFEEELLGLKTWIRANDIKCRVVEKYYFDNEEDGIICCY
jgi:hypothetical protein